MMLGSWSEQVVQWPCPEKRSQALRGRNLTRDIRVDGAQRCIGPLVEDPSGAVFFPYPWTPSSCLRKSCGEAASVATTAAAVHDWTFYQAAVELCQRANLPIPWITRRGTHLEQGRATGS